MGYTHYWEGRNGTELNDWDLRIADCDKIIAAIKNIPLDREFNGKDALAFNGVGDDSYETFCVLRDAKEAQRLGFEFCKTAYKPYDILVTACLCVLAESGLKVSSDGDADEWEEGRTLAERVLGRPVACPRGVSK